MKKITNRAFTMIELLLVVIILGILLLIIPNLDLFYLNAVKKEGVLLVRTIVEQERIYKADNGEFETDCQKIQNWKPVKTILIDNKYFKPEEENSSDIDLDGSGKINYSNGYNKIVQNISTDCTKKDCKLDVEVKASPKSRAKGWHVRGHLIEGQDTKVKNKKGKNVVSTIIFEEAEETSDGSSVSDWKVIAL